MNVIDEYLFVQVVRGDWPEALPDDDELALPASRHWRLLQRLHAPGAGQLSRLLGELSPGGRTGVRYPHPELAQILDPRPLLDPAAAIAARFGASGLLIAETLAAGLAHGKALYFGTERNVGRRLAEIAAELGVAIRVL